VNETVGFQHLGRDLPAREFSPQTLSIPKRFLPSVHAHTSKTVLEIERGKKAAEGPGGIPFGQVEAKVFKRPAPSLIESDLLRKGVAGYFSGPGLEIWTLERIDELVRFPADSGMVGKESPEEPKGMHSMSQSWKHTIVPLVFSSLSLLWPFQPLHSQVLLQRDSSTAELVFLKVVTVGDPDGPGFIGTPANVGKRLDGEWVVTDQDNPNEVKFYSPEGTWIRTIGRRGEGPGEFGQAWSIEIKPDNGLRIFDAGLGRISEFDSALHPSGTEPVRVSATSLAFLPSGEVVVGSRRNGPSEVGLPLHLLDSLGSVSRSFGADPPIQDWGNSSKVRRTLAASGRDAVWAGERTRYSFERWTVQGNRTHSFWSDVPWYPPHERFGRKSDRSSPPNPGIYAIHEDSRGLVWLAIRVPDENWEEAYEQGRDPYGRERWVARDDNKLYDTIVEVVDPLAGRVMASGRHPLAVWGFTNEGQLVFNRYLGDLSHVVEIWKAEAPHSE